MSPEIALQKAVRARLVGTPAVTALVAAASILDTNARPAPDPSILMGEGQAVDENDSVQRLLTRVYMDLHVWKKEPSTAGVKAIADAIRAAVLAGRLAAEGRFHIADCRVQATRFIRDPDGETSHGIVTLSAKVQEL